MNKYQRKIRTEIVDVYDVLRAFDVTCPALQHAAKKILAPGQRGHKDRLTDLKEALQSVQRAIEMEMEIVTDEVFAMDMDIREF